MEVEKPPEKLLLLRSKADSIIIDSNISPNSEYIVYTSVLCTKLFKFLTANDAKSDIKQITLPEAITDIQHLAFCPNSQQIYFVKSDQTIIVYNIMTSDVHSFTIDFKGVIRCLDVAQSGTTVAFVTTSNQIGVWSRKSSKWFKIVELPTYKCPVTSIKFASGTKLSIVYADMKYFEYNYTEKKFVFSTNLNGKCSSKIPDNYPVRNILHVQKQENFVIFQTEYGVFSLKKLTGTEVDAEMKITKKKKMETGEEESQCQIKIKQLKQFEVSPFN